MEKFMLLEGERLDEIGFGELKLIQKPEEFCYGVDAVILADFTAKNMNRGRGKTGIVADLGSGTGIVPIILQHKATIEKVYAVEVQEDSFNRIERNISMNDLKEKLEGIHSDILDLLDSRPELKNLCHVVTCNPPYFMAGGHGLTNENDAKRIARHETTANLEDFIRVAANLLKDKGEFFMVHRPSRLVDICELCRKYKLEPKTLRFVAPNKSSRPNIILVRAVKYGNAELIVKEPLYVYKEEERSYTDEIMDIYERV